VHALAPSLYIRYISFCIHGYKRLLVLLAMYYILLRNGDCFSSHTHTHTHTHTHAHTHTRTHAHTHTRTHAHSNMNG